MFSRRIHHLIGKDISRLFGLDGVSLRKNEIYIGNTRGVNCSTSMNDTELLQRWPLGSLVMDKIRNVCEESLSYSSPFVLILNCWLLLVAQIQSFEGLTGPIAFDANGTRVNYTINIHRLALNMPLAKVNKAYFLLCSNVLNK